MKVTSITPFPIADDHGSRFIVVKVDTDAGISGLGEVGLPAWGTAACAAVHQLSEEVVGASPFETERVWQLLSRGGFFPARGVYAAALSAIDIALWDIKGKALGMPLYRLLGGPVRDRVVCYPHAQGEDVVALVDASRRLVGEGWRFVRFHLPEGSLPVRTGGATVFDPRRSARDAIACVEGVRDAVGDHVEICLDVHTRLDAPQAALFCRQLEPYRPFFVEDPLRSEDTAGYVRLSRATAVPIAAGEQWDSKWAFREVIEKDAIAYARIDLCIVGGLTEALKIAHWAEVHGIDVAPHNPLSPVSSAACVALCMALTNVGVQEMPRRPGSTLTDVFPVQVGWDDGYAYCHDAPGLGIEFDEEAARRRACEPDTWLPQFRRPDGSFTNW